MSKHLVLTTDYSSSSFRRNLVTAEKGCW